jgi:hypothetical protein
MSTPALQPCANPEAPGSKRTYEVATDKSATRNFDLIRAHNDCTRSIDGAAGLIESELPGWGWNCGCCEHRNGASLYVPGSSRIRGSFSRANGSRPEDLQLLQHPKWGTLFDNGFHCDRGGTVPLAMLTVFLEATIALMCARPVELPISMNDRIVRRA